MKYTLACMAFLLLLSACGSNEQKPDEGDRPSVTEAPIPLPEPGVNWYRQYTGTIAGKQVTVDLQCSAGQISGYYSYDGIDMLMELRADNDSASGVSIYIYENDPRSRNERKNDHWDITFFKGRAEGSWISADNTKEYSIELKEADYKNSYSFNVYAKEDSTVAKLKGFSVSAHTTDQWCMPGEMAAADKQFLSSTILKILGCKQGQTADDCIRQSSNEYFENYRSEIDSNITEDESHIYNHEMTRILLVVYNKNGFVIVEEGGYAYMGGAHGIHGNTYNCIDVRDKKVWHLDDIMVVDTNALSALLEAEARRIFDIAATDKLSERLLVDTIKPMENLYFTSAGITFVYNPYAIASYADGAVSLHIPYSSLTNYLTPAFKTRMNL